MYQMICSLQQSWRRTMKFHQATTCKETRVQNRSTSRLLILLAPNSHHQKDKRKTNTWHHLLSKWQWTSNSNSSSSSTISNQHLWLKKWPKTKFICHNKATKARCLLWISSMKVIWCQHKWMETSSSLTISCCPSYHLRWWTIRDGSQGWIIRQDWAATIQWLDSEKLITLLEIKVLTIMDNNILEVLLRNESTYNIDLLCQEKLSVLKIDTN